MLQIAVAVGIHHAMIVIFLFWPDQVSSKQKDGQSEQMDMLSKRVDIVSEKVDKVLLSLEGKVAPVDEKGNGW